MSFAKLFKTTTTMLFAGTLPTIPDSSTPAPPEVPYNATSLPTGAPPNRTLSIFSYTPTLSFPISSVPPLLWTLLLLSALTVLARAYTHAKHLSHLTFWAARERAAREQAYSRLWTTRSWWVLSLLCDQWLRGLLPGDGMWTASNAASLRAKRDKSALRSLLRMGIYPLFIQDGGGPTTTLEKEAALSPWGRITWPVWKQSKRRAVFEFVVPRARGWMIEEDAVMSEEERERREADRAYLMFMDTLVWSWRLRRAARWRTAATSTVVLTLEDLPRRERERMRMFPKAPLPFPLREMTFTSKFAPDPKVPTEVGTTSRYRFLLPFKMDRVLRGGWVKRLMKDVANWLTGGYLLNAVKLPIVRIEAPDDDTIELDKEILLIAENLRLDQDWDEDVAEYDLREAYFSNNLEPVE